MFIKQHKSAVMMSSAAVLLMALGNGAFADHGTCINPNSDSDGDGWGYENSQGQTYGGGDNTGFHSCQMPTGTSDTTDPVVTVSGPAANATVNSSPTLSGTATDEAGGSGITSVRVVIWSNANSGFVNLNGNATSWTQFEAQIPGGDPSSANWTLATSLPSGSYQIQVRSYDAAGNEATQVNRDFVVEAGNPPPPPTPDPSPSDCIDTDGDGWGWRNPPGETCRVDDQTPTTPTGSKSLSTVDKNGFSTIEVADLVLTNNLYGAKSEQWIPKDELVQAGIYNQSDFPNETTENGIVYVIISPYDEADALQWVTTYNGSSNCSDDASLASIKLRYNIKNNEPLPNTTPGVIRKNVSASKTAYLDF